MTISGPAGPPAPYPVHFGYGGGNPPATSGVPGPPPGPGVAPPFAAPPTEGRTARIWLGLGVGALAVVLCCGGGAAALVGLAVAGTQAINEQARAVVRDYYQAVRDEDYGKAYELLCDDDQQRETPQEFQRRVSAEPQISSFKVEEATVTNEVIVPVDVSYTGGSRATQRVRMAQDGRTGTLEVCGIS